MPLLARRAAAASLLLATLLVGMPYAAEAQSALSGAAPLAGQPGAQSAGQPGVTGAAPQTASPGTSVRPRRATRTRRPATQRSPRRPVQQPAVPPSGTTGGNTAG